MLDHPPPGEFGRYGSGPRQRQVLPNFYQICRTIATPEIVRPEARLISMVAGIAMAMFIALFAWGANYFGWHDPMGKVQLALATSFILGAVASYKARG